METAYAHQLMIGQMCYTYIIGYQSTVSKYEFVKVTSKWIELETNLSEITHTERQMGCFFNCQP